MTTRCCFGKLAVGGRMERCSRAGVMISTFKGTDCVGTDGEGLAWCEEHRPALPLAHPHGVRWLPGLRRVCAWCDGVLEEGTPDGPVTHGICGDCFFREMGYAMDEDALARAQARRRIEEATA